MMALQATMLGYITHGMAGVDFPAAAESLGVPESFKIEAAIVIGRMGDPAALPEKLREREAPSERKSRDEIVWAGDFQGVAVAPVLLRKQERQGATALHLRPGFLLSQEYGPIRQIPAS